MGYEQHGPTPVAEDNVACIYMSKSSAMFNKGKHIDFRVYLLREFVQDGIMELFHVQTNEQAADLFTKSLPSPALVKYRFVIDGSVEESKTMSLFARVTSRAWPTAMRSDGGLEYDTASIQAHPLDEYEPNFGTHYIPAVILGIMGRGFR
eukprot:1584157-Rhodomonas_salina.1